MAFEPYLLTRKRGCYRAPLNYKEGALTPECNPDPYTNYFRERWDTLRHDPCSRKPLLDASACRLERGYPLDSDRICLPTAYDRWTTEYDKKFQYPYSHNNVDDCCRSSCPCLPGTNSEPSKLPNVKMVCTKREELPPLESMTTHKHFFYKKPTPPCPQRRIQTYTPSVCPLDGATSYRVDYPHKAPVPNGPALANMMRHGMWSMDQFSDQPFPEETEHLSQFPEKFGRKRKEIRHPNTLGPGEGPMETMTETCTQFPPKSVKFPPLPDWIENEHWVPPDTPLETCTTYKHYYQPYPLAPGAGCNKIVSPDAIPFPTLHNMWYTCCDPKVDQRTPVEMKDNDPWPYVKPCPIRYQDNLQTDPCAPFRTETTYKAEYTEKKPFRRAQSFAPLPGYTHPIQEFNDDTTNRVSFRAFTRAEYDGAKVSPGNPNGIRWGPYQCPGRVDNCEPSFPSPYGHPLKPFTCQCPCGPFDDRSSYSNDFKFRSKEMVDVLNDEVCQQPNVPKGVSLYRHDYVPQGGKKAARMPPPSSKGYRCIHPSNFRDTDSLYRVDYHNFWETTDRRNLELYRGKPTIRTRRKIETECLDDCLEDNFEIISTPPGTTVDDVLTGRVQI